jgi:peptidylprolyl isomerase
MLRLGGSRLLKRINWVMFLALLSGILLLSACAGKEGSIVAQKGDKVKVHYTGTLKDGTVFDSSVDREPLAFTVGAGQMIQGFDAAVVGMKVGQTKKVTIPAAQAYGERQEGAVQVVAKTDLPPTMTPKVGDILVASAADGSSMNVKVIAVTDTTITVDGNHELAGQDLTFEIKMVEITR